MCYAKPGPRCSAHARQHLDAARGAHPNDPNHPDVLEARDDYDATPRGLDDLRNAIRRASGAEQAELEGRLAAAEARRQAALDAFHQSNPAFDDREGEYGPDRDNPDGLQARLMGMTPVEVDTSEAAAWSRLYDVEDKIAAAKKSIGYIERRLGSRTDIPSWDQESLDRSRRTVERYEKEEAKINAEIAVHDREYRRRGGWARYFEVTSSVGHIHTSMNCSTCYPTTRYAWDTQLSGASRAEAIADWGEKCCTECMPEAPANPAFRTSGRRTQAERDAKAAEKAERDAIKARKAITTPAGHPLKVDGDTYKTFVSARNAFVDQLALAADRQWMAEHEAVDEDHKQHLLRLAERGRQNAAQLRDALVSHPHEGKPAEEWDAYAAPRVAKKARH